MVRQFYDKASGRTKTKYLGSFNMTTDPTELPQGLRLRPGVAMEDIRIWEVKDWLERHGTFGALPVLPPGVEAKLRERIRAELEQEAEIARPADLERAAEAISAAAVQLIGAAGYCYATGVKLSKGMLTFVGTDIGSCRTELDRLKVRANVVRAEYQRFELAMKDSKLMRKAIRKVALHKTPDSPDGRSSSAGVPSASHS